ncbi:uncharacterized protein RHIMIDRAFT_311975 [Rhizopus microsporus ATCC 52813]|uniref:Uncharacterized protein n=1 Tax=Rhizopus microsporus ATCC 52813 TaxID=1340429 RepID=A0A2G4T153_RHIZD|nr:uncharacterized protein RHIMIDRAFT_311975 [Rhizopus microsporus ATCC 52813]PHZ14755.1 hypothetical protein RHIMIDRAFT_311975 [Rhizopus microsporus ATCC 52813]
MSQFKITLTPSVQYELWLPDFWTLCSPKDWAPVNYLTQLLITHPELSKRIAHQRLAKDVNLMKKHVVPGTMAEAAITNLIKILQTLNSDNTIIQFWENHVALISDSSLNYNSSKLRLKASMARETADESERLIQKRRKVNQKEAEDQGEAENLSKVEEKAGSTIWDEWKEFLQDPHIALSCHALSPERHSIIWCGKLVRRRFFMPESLYTRTVQEIPPPPHVSILQSCQDPYKSILEAEDIQHMREEMKLLRRIVHENNDGQVEFLLDMLDIFVKTVFPTDGQSLIHSENCFKSDSLWPVQQAVAVYLRSKGHKAIFFTGEEELESMTRELEKDGQTDGRYKYYADGVLRVNNLEVLIMEASSAYDKATNIKFSFDYYKGMFGVLSIMKHIASKYKYASFDTFKALKIHFIHAFGSAVRHWSISFPEANISLMTKLDRSEIPLKLNDDNAKEANPLRHFIQLHLNLTVTLEETINILAQLKIEHQANYDSMPAVTLEDHVDCLIVRLNEKKHAKDLNRDGPQSP